MSPRDALALIEAFRGAYERKDLPAVMSLFGAEPRERGAVGRAAVEQLYAQGFAAFQEIRYELSQLDVRPATADGEVTVQGHYRIRATRVASGAAAADLSGQIRWLLRPESGALRIVRIAYDAAPPTPPSLGGPVSLSPGGGEGQGEAVLRPAPPKPAPAVAATVPPPVPPPQVLALIEAFRAAYERRDLSGVMALFGVEPRERGAVGRAAVERLYTRAFASLDQVRYELNQLEVKQAETEGSFVVQGRFRIRAMRPATPPQPVDAVGPIRWVVHREGGALRIVAVEYEVAGR